MKVKCPNCSSVGRVPAERIPASGANIRCPSCAFVFFVGGPDSVNVLDGSDPGRSGIPSMSQTQSLPLPDPTQFRRTVASADHAVVQQASDRSASSSPPDGETSTLPLQPDTSGFGGHSRAEGAAQPADSARQGGSVPEPRASSDIGESSGMGSELNLDELLSDRDPSSPSNPPPAENSPAAPHGEQLPTEGAATLPPSTANAGYQSAVRSALSGLVPPAASSAAPNAAAARTEVAEAPTPRAAGKDAYKVRAQSGIVYDFHDFLAVRKWLGTRATFDDLEVSADAGGTYVPVTEHPELQDVKPTGMRPRTGSLPAVPDVRPAPSTSPAPTPRNAATGSVDAVPSPRAVTGSSPVVPDDASGAGRNARPSRTTSTAGKEKGDAKKIGTIPRSRAIAYILLMSSAILAAVVYFMPAPDPIPNTPAGQHLRWIMGVINNGSSRLTMDDVAGHLTADAFQQAGSAIRERLIAMDSWKNEFTILNIHEPTPQTYVVVELTTETGNLGYVAIGTEPSAPYKVNLFLAGSGNPPANLLRPPQ